MPMQPRTDVMHVNTYRSQSAPLPYVICFRNSITEGRNHPLHDHTLRPCVSVHNEGHGEHGAVQMYGLAERVVALSYTELAYTNEHGRGEEHRDVRNKTLPLIPFVFY